MVLTVAICTYRRFDRLDECLQALVDQCRGRFRIVVVDNSMDPGRSERSNSRWTIQDDLEYLVADRSGLSFSRNLALQHCTTEYLAFVDDDAVVRPGWTEAMLDVIEEFGGTAGIIGGPCFPRWESEPPLWLRDELLKPLALVDWGPETEVIARSDPRWLVGANTTYRVDVLRGIGGFSEELGRQADLLLCHEELLANDQIRQLGFSMIYEPRAAVDHLVQSERMTATWHYEDAFWEGVSHALHTGQLAAERLESLRLTLAEALNRNRPAEGFEATYDSVLGLRVKAADLARELLRDEDGALEVERELPVVVVLVPVLNRRAQIRTTIESVLSQQGDFIVRLHVQDGGSTDGTLEELAAIQEGLASDRLAYGAKSLVLTCQSAADDGIYDALLKGAATIAAEDDSVMTWLNAGDFLLPGAFAFATQAMSTLERVSWIVPPILVYEGNRPCMYVQACYPRELVEAGIADGVHWNTIQQEGSFWRFRLWREVGGVDGLLKAAGDWMLWKNFAALETPFAATVPLAAFVRGGPQVSLTGDLYQREIARCLPSSERRAAAERLPTDVRSATLDGTLTVNWLPLSSTITGMSAQGATVSEAFSVMDDQQVTLSGASSNELIAQLEKVDPGLLSLDGPVGDVGSSYEFIRGVYRRLPMSLRLKLRPLVRRLFMRQSGAD